MINFSLSDLRHICDSSTFFSAYDINEASLSEVKSVEMVSDEIMLINARTQGKKLYKQAINIYAQEEGIKIIGKCSCEVGRNCKHVLSAALCYLDKEALTEQNKELSANAYKDEKQDWLQNLKQSFEDAVEKEFLTSTIVLYELHLCKLAKEVELSIFTARELKSGGYGKVNRGRANALFNNFKKPDYLRENDKEIIEIFQVLSQGKKTTTRLHGKLGAMLLKGAIETGRCFWQKGHKNALSFADDKNLELEWKEDGKKAFLDFCLDEKTYLIESNPLYYVNTKEKTVGYLHSTLTHEQINLILKAPKIEQDEVESFVLDMAKSLPQLLVKPPQSIQLEIKENSKIRPLLHLNNQEGQNRLTLGFKYDDIYLKYTPQHSSFIDISRKIKLERNLEIENFYNEKIFKFGFEKKNAFFVTKEMHIWKRFLEGLDELEKEGFEIIKEPSFKLNFSHVNRVDVKVEQTSHWFDVGMHIMFEDKKLPLLPILSQLLNKGIDLKKSEEVYFNLEDETYITLPSKLLEPILKTFYELLDKPNSEGFKLRPYEANVMENFKNDFFDVQDSSELKKISQEMRKKEKINTHAKGLKAELRDYQKEGVAWMQFLRKYGFGGILADDMGLGKTVQTLAHLLIEKESERLNIPSLIVAPTSLLGNWKSEVEKFTPSLSVALYYGSNRKEILLNINKYDLIITTYTLVNLDREKLKKQRFYYLILDEAQKIKNARSESAKAIKELNAQYFLALSGTPMENHLGELHSIFDTVMPGFLGSLSSFKTLYQTAIEKSHCAQTQKRLNKRIKPFMLRRTKDLVAKELPPKTEMVRSVTFESEQARLYETIRVSMEKSVRETIKTMGIGASHISILAALLKLRQVCCDPRLLKIEEAQKITQSAKLQMLMELVEELKQEGRKILIFSQFTSMLEIIESKMLETNTSYSLLTGSTLKRQDEIDAFNKGESDVFLISLKAGGVGLNLTTADTVIHYDPWWNPAAQDQATDRAYRIGQDKPVFVYKLIVENSVEEKIVKMQEDKKALANAIYEGKEKGFSKMNEKDLLELFK